VGPST